MGSEMCIRDRLPSSRSASGRRPASCRSEQPPSPPAAVLVRWHGMGAATAPAISNSVRTMPLAWLPALRVSSRTPSSRAEAPPHSFLPSKAKQKGEGKEKKFLSPPFGGKTERGKRTGAGGEEVVSCDRFHCTGGVRAALACVLLHAPLHAKGRRAAQPRSLPLSASPSVLAPEPRVVLVPRLPGSGALPR